MPSARKSEEKPELVSYNPAWPTEFEAEAARIERALGASLAHRSSWLDLDSRERRTLLFRDYLRDHGDVARDYEQLKRQLLNQLESTNDESREAYARAKTDFIETIVAVALRDRYR
jgi:GrpB-like predicted nucleotidyltransferase (UPF0157 family)